MPHKDMWIDRDQDSAPAWMVVAGVAALAAYGVSRRQMPGWFVAIAATPLLYRGFTGRWPAVTSDEPRVALSGDRGLHLRDAVRLEVPIADVYRFWRRLENLPRFMAHLESVVEHDQTRSTWTAVGPTGRRLVWDAKIVNEVENSLIAWQSLPGADVVSAGSVHFDAVRAGRSTQVTVHLQYSPPAGRAGALVSSLFGKIPSAMLREDLRRLKRVLEAGELPRTAPDEVAP